MLTRVNHMSNNFESTDNWRRLWFGLKLNIPGSLFGTQVCQLVDVFFVNIGEDSHTAEIRDREQIDSCRDNFPDGPVSFEHSAAERSSNFDIGPGLANLRIRERYSITDSFRFSVNLGNFFLGFPPRSQRPLSSLDCDHVGLILLLCFTNDLPRDTPLFQAFQSLYRCF